MEDQMELTQTPEEQAIEALPEPLRDRFVVSEQRVVESLKAYEKIREMQIKRAFSCTSPGDWKDMGGDKLFLEGCGAERVLAGMLARWEFKPRSLARVDFPDNDKVPYAYEVTGEATIQMPGGLPPITIEVYFARGCDEFFQAKAKKQGRMVDPLDVKRAALTQWNRRAITELAGLRNVTREYMLRYMPQEFVDAIPKIQRFGKGADVPDAGTESAEDMKAACEAYQSIWKELQRLAPGKRRLWPFLVGAVSHDPSGKFPARANVIGLSEKQAGFFVSKLRRIGDDPQEAMAAVDAGAKALGRESPAWDD